MNASLLLLAEGNVGFRREKKQGKSENRIEKLSKQTNRFIGAVARDPSTFKLFVGRTHEFVLIREANKCFDDGFGE